MFIMSQRGLCMNTVVCVGFLFGGGPRSMCECPSSAGTAVCLCCALSDTGGLSVRERQNA